MGKPDVPVARRLDYTVCAIAHAVGAAFIKQNHYAHSCSNTAVYMFGLYNKLGKLVGVCQWLPPTMGAAKTVNTDWRSVLCLSRLVVLDSEPQNTESLFLARCIRCIKAESKWRSLLTYADTAYGHTGTIYRSTNWTYVGLTTPSVRYLSKDGKQVAKKSTKNRTKGEMLAMGAQLTNRSSKHKYVLHLT